MEQDVVLQMGLLVEGGLAKVALELLLACVLLHVPSHVLGGDGLPADMTLSALFQFGGQWPSYLISAALAASNFSFRCLHFTVS